MANYYDIMDELCRLGKNNGEARNAINGALYDYINESIKESDIEQKKQVAHIIYLNIFFCGEYSVDYANDRVVYFPNEKVKTYIRELIKIKSGIG